MSVRINTNIEAMNAQRNLGITAGTFAKSVEKLSSGLRINRAADDAAGLAISQKLDSQVRGLNQAQRNAQDGISMIQTAEGALQEVHSMLQRMRELSVQAANGTLSDTDRGSIALEVDQLATEITSVSGRTKFNGQSLLSGSLATSRDAGTPGTLAASGSAGAVNTSTYAVSQVDVASATAGTTYTLAAAGSNLTLSGGGVSQTVAVNALTNGNGTQTFNFDKLGVKFTVTATNSAGTGATAANIATALDTQTVITTAGNQSAQFQIGADSGQTVTVAFGQVDSSALGIQTAVNNFKTTSSVGNANSLLGVVDSAIASVSSTRATYGAYQNRLEHTIANLGVASENLSASESRIKDLDVASEMVNFTKTQILQQAGTAILAQANQAPQNILSLLR